MAKLLFVLLFCLHLEIICSVVLLTFGNYLSCEHLSNTVLKRVIFLPYCVKDCYQMENTITQEESPKENNSKSKKKVKSSQSKLQKHIKKEQELISTSDATDDVGSLLNVVKQKPSNQLTEKELRRLEWERKLAEQKLKNVSNENDKQSKAQLKAKRREHQEAQRLAKIPNKTKLEKVEKNKNEKTFINTSKASVKTLPEKELKIYNKVHEVHLVKHLYVKDGLKSVPNFTVLYNNVHPAFIKLGIQFMYKTILGSNARCLALLGAVRCLVKDLETPSKHEFCRYMETVLQICTNYLQKCRPFAVSMTNALKYFKLQLTQVNTDDTDLVKKAKLIDIIDTYIHNDIKKAGEAISLKVNQKITNGDVILNYGHSSLIKTILIDAHKDGKKFEVIVVDSRPLLEGREMLRKLVLAGIKCTYVLINSVSYIMGKVTKVMLGAHSLLTNGYVVSRIGTAQIALVAQAYNKPVLVCCETYKFSERVQTDSFVYNEIDDPNVFSTSHLLSEPTPLYKWKNIRMLTPLNLLYDVTPPDLVSAVVTEIAILPCTSVPVVLRINANEI